MVRLAAAETLGWLGDARAVKPLIAALKDGHLYMREAAAIALVGMYRSGKLDSVHKRRIWTQREWIIVRRVHTGGKHVDETSTAYCVGQTVKDQTDRHDHNETVVAGSGIDVPT